MKLTVQRLQERLREPPADLSNLADLLKTIVNPEARYLKWLTVPHASELRVVAVYSRNTGYRLPESDTRQDGPARRRTYFRRVR